MFERLKKARAAELAVYMDPIELSQVRAVLEAVAPRCCLEWGSGGSTRAILEIAPFVERYVSVEHDARWHAEVARRVTDPRLSLHLVPSDVPRPDGAQVRVRRQLVTAWDLRAEQDPALMRSYVAFPRTLGLTFDLVLVDGRARTFCLQEGFALLRSGGVLLLHDAQRPEYREAVCALGRAVFLEPWKQGQVCLVRKP